jgi:FixJ family two-component response regulator
MEIREALLDFINKPYTHASLMEAAKDMPENLMNEKRRSALHFLANA